MGVSQEKPGGEPALEEGLTPPAEPHAKQAPPLFWANPLRRELLVRLVAAAAPLAAARTGLAGV